MFTHDPYMVKAVEYLTGIAFLVLFVAFWRFVNGEAATEPVKAWTGQLADWFRVPSWLLYDRGHGWARVDGSQVLTIGVDDFAQQLIGRVEAIDLPAKGSELTRGKAAWRLHAGGKSVDMLAPVGGTVIAVNEDVRRKSDLVNADPYESGWLLRVRVPRVKDAIKGLLKGEAAREWIARVSDDLAASMSPQLGVLAQDGGLPIHGIARGIDDEHWDDVARRFLQVQGEGERS